MYAFVGSIFGAFDYDFGAGIRYPRVSPAALAFQEAFKEYLRLLALHESDPKTYPLPVKPTDPGLDPGPGYQFDAQVGV
jgi:hypothetical protein